MARSGESFHAAREESLRFAFRALAPRRRAPSPGGGGGGGDDGARGGDGNESRAASPRWCADGAASGAISRPVMRRLLLALRRFHRVPRIAEHSVELVLAVLFATLDTSHSGTISADEFSKICTVLQLHFFWAERGERLHSADALEESAGHSAGSGYGGGDGDARAAHGGGEGRAASPMRKLRRSIHERVSSLLPGGSQLNELHSEGESAAAGAPASPTRRFSYVGVSLSAEEAKEAIARSRATTLEGAAAGPKSPGAAASCSSRGAISERAGGPEPDDDDANQNPARSEASGNSSNACALGEERTGRAGRSLFGPDGASDSGSIASAFSSGGHSVSADMRGVTSVRRMSSMTSVSTSSAWIGEEQRSSPLLGERRLQQIVASRVQASAVSEGGGGLAPSCGRGCACVGHLCLALCCDSLRLLFPHANTSAGASAELRCGSKAVRSRARSIFDSVCYELLIVVVICVNFVVLLSVLEMPGEPPKLPWLPIELMFTTCVVPTLQRSLARSFRMHALRMATVTGGKLTYLASPLPQTISFFAIESIIAIVVFGCSRWWRSPLRRYNCLVAFLATVLELYVVLPTSFNNLNSIRYILLLRTLRIFFFVVSLPRFRGIGRTLAKLQQPFGVVAAFLLTIVAVFASIGVHVFGGKIVVGSEAIAGSDFDSSGYYPMNFNDFPSALVTVFALLVMNNWVRVRL